MHKCAYWLKIVRWCGPWASCFIKCSSPEPQPNYRHNPVYGQDDFILFKWIILSYSEGRKLLHLVIWILVGIFILNKSVGIKISQHPWFLAHLSWKLKWAFLITFRPSSVCPSVRTSIHPSVCFFHLLINVMI